jgi:hypothetical protein
MKFLHSLSTYRLLLHKLVGYKLYIEIHETITNFGYDIIYRTNTEKIGNVLTGLKRKAIPVTGREGP